MWRRLLLLGVMTITIFQVEPTLAADREIRLWVNAFIPKTIKGLTRVVPAGTHKGKTMISGPTLVNDCFLTDQRTFSDDSKACSRLHGEVIVSINSDGKYVIKSHSVRCDETIEVDCEDGDEECKKSAKTDRLKLTLDAKKSTVDTIVISVSMAANNPCFTPSPDIDIAGEFRVDLKNRTAAFDGKVEPFPAFEGYVTFGKKTEKLFTREPNPDSSPKNLVGDADQPVSGKATFPSDF